MTDFPIKPEITCIFWKRTYLFLEYRAQAPLSLALVQDRKSHGEVSPVTVLMGDKELEPGHYRAKLNLTIAEAGQILKQGWWTVVDQASGAPLAVSDDLMGELDNCGKIFRYGQNYYAYAVTFQLKVDYETDETSLGLYATFLKKNQRPKVRRLTNALEEAQSLKSFVRKFFMITAKRMLNWFYIAASRLTPKDGTRVLFMSENRVRIMDNLEAIDRRMTERGLDRQFRVSYSFRNIFDGRQNPLEWIRVIIKIARQDYIFVDDYVPIFAFLHLHPRTEVIQVWHAGFGFKLVGYGRFGITGSPHPYISCHKKYAYALVGNDDLREIYSEVFGIPETRLLASGMPRLEHFLEPELREAARERLYAAHPEWKGKQVITFAPTYRGYNQQSAYYDYSVIDFHRLVEYAKEKNAVFLFGKHHFIKNEIPIEPGMKEWIFDVSGEKLNDIFYVTDVLITDYSSAFYDFLLLGKPVLFFTYDRFLYSATRGVHRPIDKVAPGKVCDTFGQLMEALWTGETQGKTPAAFLMDKCLTNKVIASDQVIDFVLLHQEVEGLCKR